MTQLSPTPYRVKFLDQQGLVARNWQQFIDALVARVGGIGDITLAVETAPSVMSHAQLARAEMRIRDIQTDAFFRQGLAQVQRELQDLRDSLTLELFDTMVTPVQPVKDFFLEVGRGNIAGVDQLVKFGRATDADNAVATDIWDRANATDAQPIWTAPTAARTHQLASTSANDDGSPAGTGARTVRIYGLTDWNTAETTEDITMDGLTNVATANQYVIIYRMEVLTKGSAGPNVGVITATADTDATVTAQINAGEGQTRMAICGIPSTQTAYMTSFYGAMITSPAGDSMLFTVWVNPEPDTELTAFLTKNTQAVRAGGTSRFQHAFAPYFPIPGPAIIKLQVVADANNSDASGGFDLLKVTN